MERSHLGSCRASDLAPVSCCDLSGTSVPVAKPGTFFFTPVLFCFLKWCLRFYFVKICKGEPVLGTSRHWCGMFPEMWTYPDWLPSPKSLQYHLQNTFGRKNETQKNNGILSPGYLLHGSSSHDGLCKVLAEAQKQKQKNLDTLLSM